MPMQKISRLKRNLVKLESAFELSQNAEADAAFTKLDTDIKQAIQAFENSEVTNELIQNNISTVLESAQAILNLQEPDGTSTLTAFKEFGDLQTQIQTSYNELKALADKVNASPNKAQKLKGDIIYKLDDLDETIDILNKVHDIFKESPDFQ
jgi:DNA repair ATPase RecN